MNIIPGQFVNAISDMLLHSLWLGVLLAVAAGLIIIFTRKASVQLRYNLLVSALGIFAAAVLFIFFRQLLAEEKSISLSGIGPVTLSTPAPTDINLSASEPGVISRFMHEHANTIVFTWLMIVLARTLQLLTGLQSLYFLRRRNISAIKSEWEEKVKMLAEQLGIKRIINIAESGIAKVPMVIGHLKPLILIPAGLITALPASAIEAILVHELAHILRRDYLMNLLVRCFEILFFFNPAVTWIAALIRAERENCCDDIALAHTNKTEYIKALVACQEYNLGSPAYAMAFSGRKDNLLGRVKRMISNNNPSLNSIERTILAFGLFTAVFFITAFSSTEKINPAATKIAGASITTRFSQEQVEPREKPAYTEPLIPKSSSLATEDTVPQQPVHDKAVCQPAQVSEPTDVSIPKDGLQIRLVKPNDNLSQLSHIDAKLSSLQLNSKPVTPTDEYRHINEISPITSARVGAPQYNYRNYRTEKPYPANYKAYQEDANREKLTAALIDNGIIKNHDELLSFKLSDTEFIVNGKKIPEDTYQKFRQEFVKAPEKGKQGSWAWMYNYEQSTRISTTTN